MRKRELLERIEWLEARESEHSQIVYDMQQRIEGLELRLAMLETFRHSIWCLSTDQGWQLPPPSAVGDPRHEGGDIPPPNRVHCGSPPISSYKGRGEEP